MWRGREFIFFCLVIRLNGKILFIDLGVFLNWFKFVSVFIFSFCD